MSDGPRDAAAAEVAEREAATRAEIDKQLAAMSPGDKIVEALKIEAGQKTSLGHKPTDKWSFDGSVASCFDDMLERSIPQYGVMRDLVAALAAKHIRGAHAVCPPGKVPAQVVDLGAARGEAIAELLRAFGAQVRWHLVECAPAMLEELRRRFKGWIESGVISVDARDLRTVYPLLPAPAAVTLCVLTLQFVPIEYRQRVVRQAYKSTAPGGAFILVEKVLGSTAELDEVLVERYRARKEAAGYSREEIARKALSLEGVLVPVTAKWNEELLRAAGFESVECVWRWCNFAAWLAVREP